MMNVPARPSRHIASDMPEFVHDLVGVSAEFCGDVNGNLIGTERYVPLH